jgi:two-component system LytT family sensor kinase
MARVPWYGLARRRTYPTRIKGCAMENGFKRDLRNYPLYFLLWTVVGLFYFSQVLTQRLLTHDTTPWWHYLVAWLSGVYIWALLTPVILLLGRRFPIGRGTDGRRAVAFHLLLSAAFSACELCLEGVLYSQLHLFPTLTGFRKSAEQLLLRGFHGGVLDYWIVLGLQWGALYYRGFQQRSQEALKLELRASELQSQLVSAQLTALKMQLQPHFLFNTLNAIMVLVRQHKSKDAEQMLGHLGDLLRGVLEDVDAQEIPLSRELEYLRLYLAIEQVRFPDRLRVEIATDPATHAAAVPQLVLQPIVENAIRHGIGRSLAAGHILISASKINETVELRVQDDGPGFPPGDLPEDSGIGLTNTRARLQQHYGPDARLDIHNGDRGGVIVTMSIPLRQCR